MVDMHAPGVEVRPLRQITGEAEFNEVYLTDARIADADRIGDVGDGWRVSMTTLMNERTTIGAASGGGSGSAASASRASQEAIDIWKQATGGRPRPRRAATGIARLWIESEVLRYTNQRAAAKARAGNPGPEGSIAKLALANMNKSTYELCIDLLGADGIVGYDYTFKRPSEARARSAARLGAQDVPARPRQLDRGWHVGDHAQYPRRAHPRPAGRAARRPRPAVVAGTREAERPRSNA